MADYPLVSIIVPIYKVEKYLNECVDSLLSQTYPNIELILVDDGSPDKCPQICDSYAEKYSNIRAIHKPNGGVSDARNVGMSVATGEYIAFFDSDDVADPGLYQTAIELMTQYDAQVVCFNCKNFKVLDNGEIVSKPRYRDTGTINVLTGEEALIQVLSFGYIGNAVITKLYRRDVLSGISFAKGLIFEGAIHTASVFLRAERVVRTTAPLFNYRVRKGSLTHGDHENFYDVVPSREIRMKEVMAVAPHLLPYLQSEYVTSFFDSLSRVGMFTDRQAQNRQMIADFKMWLKENKVSISKMRRIELFCISYLPNGYKVYRLIEKMVVRIYRMIK